MIVELDSRCSNPKCIITTEQELKNMFKPAGDGGYRCLYCEQKLQASSLLQQDETLN